MLEISFFTLFHDAAFAFTRFRRFWRQIYPVFQFRLRILFILLLLAPRIVRDRAVRLLELNASMLILVFLWLEGVNHVLFETISLRVWNST